MPKKKIDAPPPAPAPLPTAPRDGAVFQLPTGEKWLYRADAGGWCPVLRKPLSNREYLIPLI